MAHSTSARDVTLGLSRFGLGATPASFRAVNGDIQGALLEETAKPAPLIQPRDSILSSPGAYRTFRTYQDEIKAAKEAQKVSTPDAQSAGSPGAAAKAVRKDGMRELVQAETLARIDASKQSPTGFAERLVLFWSNHFCVSIRKSPFVRAMAGPYEREAIRPHVFGRFEDMLLAVEKHPAMLVYLDNEQSIGPNSRAGLRREKGLNENFAREIMELHTLGVDGGYTQDDVTSFARILTGWRFARQDNPVASEGQFFFQREHHEPGPHRLLNVVYRDEGVEQGEAALRALANSAAAARFIAKKLALHFVSDTPPEGLVLQLAKVFTGTRGDLAEVSRALIQAPEAWTSERSKLRLPYEFVAASVRATGMTLDAGQIDRSLASMGQPLWAPPGPNGFSSSTGVWASPEGIKARLDFAARFSQVIRGNVKPTDLLDEILGPAVSAETRSHVAHAESRAQGFALLLMSPEFQRR